MAEEPLAFEPPTEEESDRWAMQARGVATPLRDTNPERILRLLAARKHLFARLRALIGVIQQYQPGGSPPPGDEVVLARWILSDLKAQVAVETRRIARDLARPVMEWGMRHFDDIEGEDEWCELERFVRANTEPPYPAPDDIPAGLQEVRRDRARRARLDEIERRVRVERELVAAHDDLFRLQASARAVVDRMLEIYRPEYFARAGAREPESLLGRTCALARLLGMEVKP